MHFPQCVFPLAIKNEFFACIKPAIYRLTFHREREKSQSAGFVRVWDFLRRGVPRYYLEFANVSSQS